MKFAIVVLTALVLGAESRTYKHKLTLKEDVFDVEYTDESDVFYFKMMAKTTGWVGLALTDEKGGVDMKNYDIALGGMRGNYTNQTYLGDYWSVSETKPTYDTTQSLTLVNAMEKDGMTTIEFSRKADTGDSAQDMKIEAGKPVYLAWAIGEKDAISNTDFKQHKDKAGGGRGHTDVGYDLYTGKDITTSSAASIIPSIIVLGLVALYHFM